LPAASAQKRVPAVGVCNDNADHCFKADLAERPLAAETVTETLFVDKILPVWNTWPIDLKTYVPQAEQPDLQPNEQIVLTWDVLAEEGLIDRHIGLFSQEGSQLRWAIQRHPRRAVQAPLKEPPAWLSSTCEGATSRGYWSRAMLHALPRAPSLIARAG